MRLTNEWFMTISETESNAMIIVNGRDKIEEFIASGKFKERAEVSWKYTPAAQQMPDDATATLMEEVQEALQKAMEKNKLAIMTGVYTGDGERTWVFYTRNVAAFGEMLNTALAPFELLPITIYTEKDAAWNEYHEMYQSKPLDDDQECDEEEFNG